VSKLWARLFGSTCEHQNTITVRSVGVERTVCEACAHVSFSIASSLLVPHQTAPDDVETVNLPKVVGL